MHCTATVNKNRPFLIYGETEKKSKFFDRPKTHIMLINIKN